MSDNLFAYIGRKKEQVLATIEEQGKLTDELKAQILAAETQVLVEDLYRPYRPKRRTRAIIAKEKGLEPLAQIILAQEVTEPLETIAEQYVSEEKEVKDVADAIAGARDIIAEQISDNADYRKYIRDITREEVSLPQLPRMKRRSLFMRCIMNIRSRLKRLPVIVFSR